MQNAIRAEIKRISQRIFAKEAASEKRESEYRQKFSKRTGLKAKYPSNKRQIELPRHFDPTYCARNANFLAKTLWHKVLSGSYTPQCAAQYEIPKPGGGERIIMAFSIPDAALANVTLRRSRDRNLKRLSPSSFAYHPDKNVFDAIISLSQFSDKRKLFAVQIDFEKYFDLLPKGYLLDLVNDKDIISLTPHEKMIYESFLKHPYAPAQDVKAGRNVQFRHRGTPQGSSVSLLLANLASHSLDEKLSSQPGRFVRFADDVVALCENYADAQQIENSFTEHCRSSGIRINEVKSPGISLISKKDQEIRTSPHFDYLGYRFCPDGLTLPDKKVAAIKAKVSRLVHIYLISYLEQGFSDKRTGLDPEFDWDLLGLIYEVRRLLYGGLSEADIAQFLSNGKKLAHVRGLMGFYCLLEDSSTLRDLDGWLLSIVRRAQARRQKILQTKYKTSCPLPSRKSLADGSWLNPAAWSNNDDLPETRVPSFVRGWRAARKHYYTFGLEGVEAPRYGRYDGLEELTSYA